MFLTYSIIFKKDTIRINSWLGFKFGQFFQLGHFRQIFIQLSMKQKKKKRDLHQIVHETTKKRIKKDITRWAQIDKLNGSSSHPRLKGPCHPYLLGYLIHVHGLLEDPPNE